MKTAIKHIILGLIFFLSGCLNLDELDKVVQDDFDTRYPNYEFLSYEIGEGDLAVVYVHISYKKSDTDSVFSEEWQYWKIDNGWRHRDEYLNKEHDTTTSYIGADLNESLKELRRYLNAPIDLDNFMKTKKNHYNSGGAKNMDYHFKPEKPGFYYSFFLFPSPQGLSNTDWVEKYGEDGIRFLTYIYGHEISDTSEKEVIEFKSRVYDTDLQRSNFIESDIEDIINRFGENFVIVDSTISYFQDNKILTFWINENKVTQFRYLKTNAQIDTLFIQNNIENYQWKY